MKVKNKTWVSDNIMHDYAVWKTVCTAIMQLTNIKGLMYDHFGQIMSHSFEHQPC